MPKLTADEAPAVDAARGTIGVGTYEEFEDAMIPASSPPGESGTPDILTPDPVPAAAALQRSACTTARL